MYTGRATAPLAPPSFPTPMDTTWHAFTWKAFLWPAIPVILQLIYYYNDYNIIV